MSKAILVLGHGPGISDAVARRFGREGYRVGLVARSSDKLAASANALRAAGLHVATFSADLGDPEAARGVVRAARKELGPLSALHWNAYSGAAGDLMTADAAAVRAALDIATTSLIGVVQEAHADLKAAKGAVLVTNGGFANLDAQTNASGVQFNAMGLSLANAAKRKLVGLLSERLRDDGIFVGEVMVMGLVKGTAWDQGGATIPPERVADAFWELAHTRERISIDVS